ncbi:MAG TPA: amino acid permease [Methanocella sp.]|nr:amino acid permease [Methanocella sp.]
MRALSGIFRTRSIAEVEKSAKARKMKRTLTALDLVLLGIGCIVGTGIFVLTGVAAARYAGPGIIFSFVIAGFACVLTALVYAELASMIPVTGSTYTYAYVALGEIVAWLVGWSMLMEYLIAASMVSVGWSAYLTGLFLAGGIALPHAFTTPLTEGGIINMPAVLIAIFIGWLLFRGVKESSRFNNFMVLVKIGAILIFLALAVPKVSPDHWHPLLPFGITGMLTGAAIVFTAFIGFDAVCTAAEEARNPRKDLPIGIVGSILICTLLYVAVAAVLTGVVPYDQLNNPEPVTYALRVIGYNMGSALVGIGAISGITTVLIVLYYGLTRIIFAMSRDCLFPSGLCQIHQSYGTPYIVTIIAGTIIAVIAGIAPVNVLAELVNIGTLFAFITTSAGAIALRVRMPNASRPFRCPGLFITAPISIILCLILMAMLPITAWVRFVAWIVVGLGVYFVYGHKKAMTAAEK